MKTLNIFKRSSIVFFALSTFLFTSCDDNEDLPPEEHDHETITDVKLIFTNTQDASDVVTALAQDEDGEGAKPLEIKDEITLGSNKTYSLTFEILNTLGHDDHDDHEEEHDDHDDGDEHHDEHEEEGENIGAEIVEEADEHQFFYAFTENAFTTPTGNGNIDNASDPINYEDKDSNGLPLGFETSWTTSSALNRGEFRVRLMHQPDGLKTEDSSAEISDPDFDLTFVLNIQ
ncbi:GTP cyclohydrolase [Flammeovirga pectinis]|uniref:GTP cyclohydrolase n=1 Tax=Flammeovirga pectinis TaxID=2494373 RepID=A0A3S9P509_9BACT|nr:GTP cyclohydrolase [Flammeovirga pectinis]AZQ63300.1 GTP cyclohydrolase [Flammeovirga pectinis]